MNKNNGSQVVTSRSFSALTTQAATPNAACDLKISMVVDVAW